MARNVLRIHEQFMASIRNSGDDRFMVAKYVNWYVLLISNMPQPLFAITNASQQ